jgi:hypothetical protein
MIEDQNIIQCRAAAGTQLPAKPWKAGEPVTFLYMPGGVHELRAGFQSGSIHIAVDVDESTPAVLQESFEHLTATSKQEPFVDEDHEGRKATLRFPAGRIVFGWGELHGVQGVSVTGAEPTEYGAAVVNGKTYRSFSPEFLTDADYALAERSEHGLYTFPPHVRGSLQNPARITGINFTTGALTNKPAFKAMPPVKAKQAALLPMPTLDEVYARLEQRRQANAVLDAVERRQAQ